nr:MAG TPA: tail spike protein [Caudoviricetes sp.]
MTKYATNNPLGSMDPKDLFDNAQNLDFALNDITQGIWKDRFGRNRKSFWGMEQAFSAQLLSQQQRFNYFIQNSGYKVIGDYTAGPLTITDYNQLIRYQDELWKLTAATDIPFTTTGNDAASWVNDSFHFVSVGDAALRQELVDPAFGDAMIAVQQPFTGSVPRTQHDKNTEIISVKDFGVQQQYPYDSSPAINAAISYANSLPGGATVIIPEGIWGVGGSGNFEGVILKEKVRLLGMGRGITTLKLLPAANSSVISFQHDTTLPIELGCMTIDGNKTEQTITAGGVHGVRFHGNDLLYVHDLEVRNATYYGLGVGYTVSTEKPVADSRFERLEIYGNGRAEDNQGDGFDGKRMRRCSFSDIYVHDNLQRGLDVRGEQNSFDRIYAYNNGATGISARALGVQPASISQETYITISNSYAIGNGDLGYFIANNEPPLTGFKMQVALTNCWATRNGTDGYQIRGTSMQVSLVSCFAEKNGQQGFRVNSQNSDTSLTANFTACQALSNTGAGFLSNAGVGPVRLTECVSSGNAGTYQTAIDSSDASIIGGLVSASGRAAGMKCNGSRLTVIGGTYKSGSAEAFRVDGESPSITNVKIYGDTVTTHFRINAAVTRGNVSGLDVSAVTAGTPFAVPSTVTVQGVVGGSILTGMSSKVAAGGTHGLQAISTSSTNGPTLTVDGPSADINLLLAPKGTGTVKTASSLLPTATNSFNVGSAISAWAGGFTQTAFTVTSDEKHKTKPITISDAILDAWAEVDLVQYQYLDRVEEKGVDGARWHFGVIAQRTIEAFERHGLDASRFGFLCYDEWDYQPEITQEIPAEYDEEGNLTQEAQVLIVQPERDAGSRYGIRYEEVLVMEAALQRRNYGRLISRIEALEGGEHD